MRNERIVKFKYKEMVIIEIWKKETGQPHNILLEYNELEEEMKQIAIINLFDKDVVVLF